MSEPEALGPGESCVLVVSFHPSATFLGLQQDEVLLATATDPATGDVLDEVEIVFFGRAIA